jgi:hypothetical protein
MVTAAKTHSMPQPSHTSIRNLTAEIRSGWTLGERHHRARLALLLQHRLLAEIPRNDLVEKAS